MVTIDNIDIHTAYNAIILRDGDVHLLQWPDRREPETEDWFEYSGIDVDLSDPRYQGREVEVLFYLSHDTTPTFLSALDAFYAQISAPSYRSLYLSEHGKTYRLRYLDCPDYTQRGQFSRTGKKATSLSVLFALDDPMQVIDPGVIAPTAGRQNSTYVQVDGLDLSIYGVIVQNIYNSALRMPKRKEILTRDLLSQTGIIADAEAPVTFVGQDIIIECTMLASTREVFFQNYSALFNALNVPRAINVNLAAAGRLFRCYYVKQENFAKKHAFASGVNVSFNIVLKSVD